MRKMLVALIGMLIVGSLGSYVSAEKAPWWNEAWHYRSLYEVDIGDEA